MNPRTDIVIPFRSTRQFPTESFIDQCVDTLVQYTRNYRLIFVDDNSDKIGREHIQKVADRFVESTLIRTNKQKWFTRAVNLGLRMVRTEWAVEANSDVIFGEGWLEELYAVANEIEPHKRVGLVGSVYSAEESRRYNVVYHPEYVTGHCMMFRMEALKAVADARCQHFLDNESAKEYLDEITPKAIHIFSDNHICYDLNSIGYVTVQAFKSGVGHIAGKSWGHLLGTIPQTVEQVDYQYD